MASLGAGRKAVVISKQYPKEFRQDVALDPDAALTQMATDYRIHGGTLDTRLRQQRIDSGEHEGVSRSQSQQLRDLRRRNRLLEQDSEVSRRASAYVSQANLPEKGTSHS